MVVFRSKRPKNDRPKIRRKHVVVFRSKRPGNDRSFSGRLIGEIFAQNDRGRFLVVPSVVGLARVAHTFLCMTNVASSFSPTIFNISPHPSKTFETTSALPLCIAYVRSSMCSDVSECKQSALLLRYCLTFKSAATPFSYPFRLLIRKF